MKIIGLCLSLSLVAGCSTTYKQDGTDLIEDSRSAIIDTSSCEKNQCPVIQEVDDKWRGLGQFKLYKLMPGIRKLRLIFVANGVTAKRAFLVEFRAEPGRTYVMRANADFEAMTWNPEVLDASTKEVVSKHTGFAWAY
ncbi:MAG: hypothetical protein CVU31_09955 [Betaproteobacteria bacterium HGW-Betaproteobacteria-4]|nr:MAG: hypothetical protein CVU31_09955 [Betaproteobacteria bacterium HGW-Betaproteobacteria-4]